MTVIYGSQSYVADFDYFENMSPNIAICDIDASFTNNIELPCVPNEQMYIRILNLMKNYRVNQYDMAFPTNLGETDDLVQQVRQTFFQILKPFVKGLDTYIDRSQDQASFYTYFNTQKYLSNFDDTEVQYKFAENLIKSSQFIHFCDNSFYDELNNYHMLKAIMLSRAEGGDISTYESPFKTASDGVRVVWPETEPVVFNFRLPQNHHRVALFEKIFYMNQDQVRRRNKDSSRYTDKLILEKIDFAGIIEIIKKLYPIKLKGTHLIYKYQDEKLLQKTFSKRIQEAYQKSEINSDGQITNNVLPRSMIGMSKDNQNEKRLQTTIFNKGTKVSDGIANLFVEQTEGDQVYYQQDGSYITAQRISMKFNKSNNMNGISRFEQKESNNHSRFDMNGGDLPYMYMSSQNTEKQRILMKTGDENDSSYDASSISIIEREQQKEIENNERKIIKLIYGETGLVAFLHHIFGLLEDVELKQVNYYFALKEQLKLLNATKDQAQMNFDVIEERSNENSPSGKKTPSPSPLYLQFNSPNDRNQDSGGNQLSKHKSSSQLKNYWQLFKQQDAWMLIDRWENMSECLKHSYQFILFKQKMYEAFECVEDGYCKIFFDLLQFPPNKNQFFPKTRFMQIWETLSKQQKLQIFQKYGQNQERPSVNLISKEFLSEQKFKQPASQSNNDSLYSFCESPNPRASVVSKMDDSIFFHARAEKTYIQKKEDASNSLENSKFNARIQHDSSNLRSSAKCMPAKVEKERKSHAAGFNQVRDFLSEKKKSIFFKKKSSQDISDTQSYKSEKPGPSTFGKQSSNRNVLTIPKPGLQMTKENSEQVLPKDQLEFQGQGVKTDSELGSRKVTYYEHANSSIVIQNYDMKNHFKITEINLKPMTDPDEKAGNLLFSIVKFWQNNADNVEKPGRFRESQVSQVQQELKKYDISFETLKNSKLDFQNNNDNVKQAFFLNLFNFLVLYKLAVLMISEPEAVKMLCIYNKWQSFLQSCQVYISGVKMDAYMILHSILRANFELPQISNFLLERIEYENNDFVVQCPNKLQCFGIFLPLKGIPHFKVFQAARLQEQLRGQAEKFLQKRLKIRQDQRLIIMPKMINWYLKDFNTNHQVPKLYELFQFFNHSVFKKDSDVRRSIEKVMSRLIDPEKEKEYIIDYKSFDWQFRLSRLMHYFEDSKQL